MKASAHRQLHDNKNFNLIEAKTYITMHDEDEGKRKRKKKKDKKIHIRNAKECLKNKNKV